MEGLSSRSSYFFRGSERALAIIDDERLAHALEAERCSIVAGSSNKGRIGLAYELIGHCKQQSRSPDAEIREVFQLTALDPLPLHKSSIRSAKVR